MTKEVQEVICNSLRGGSSLLSMDLASDGLSWVKGICQRLEASCNEYVDACNKYVDTASEQIVKICEEVYDWENPQIVEGIYSGVDLKHNAITNVANESSVEHVNNSLCEELSTRDHRQPSILVTDDSNLVALSGEPELRIDGHVCDGDNNKLLLNGGVCRSVYSKEGGKESSDAFTLPSDATSSSSEDRDQLVESPRDEGSSSPSGCVPPIDVNVSCREDFTPQMGPCKLETAGRFQQKDVGKVSDCREDVTSSTEKMLVQNVQTEEFGDVMLDDFCDSAIENEMILISCRADKNTSLKKRLKNIFTFPKGYKPANDHNKRNDMGARNNQASPASSVPSRGLCQNLSSKESIESDWEIL